MFEEELEEINKELKMLDKMKKSMHDIVDEEDIETDKENI